jgi:TonB family protein
MRTLWILSISLGVLLVPAWAGEVGQTGPAPEGPRVVEGAWCPPGIAPASDSDCIVPPELIHAARTVYPELARRARFTGKVDVEAVVSELGDVAAVRVLKPNPVFEEAAVAAVKQRVYRPAYQHGMPVSVRFPVTVRFGLDAEERRPTGTGGGTDIVNVAIPGELQGARVERSGSTTATTSRSK